ncbi:hypothetical protein LJC61_01805 [Ruminococcaceae bacterium OttesenSCG-928-A16]|nr:hypothetical protein [Ruminococcaceae bacterium OttesenSCG-928-A16]
MLMGMVALVVSLVLLVRGFGKNQADEADEDQEAEEQAQEKQSKNRWSVLRVLAVILGLVPGILFVLLDDMGQRFALVNRYTPIIAIVFVLATVLAIVQAAVGKRRQQDE